MKKLLLLFVANVCCCYAQQANTELIQTLSESEKIILISHEDYEAPLPVEKIGGKMTSPSAGVRTLLKNGMPNAEIIKQQMELSGELKEKLFSILSMQKKDSIWDGATCFSPHHSILLLKQGKWSYIDICFGCDHYTFSDGLPVNREEFLVTYDDWRNLETFFRMLNLNYEMRNQPNNR